MKPSKSKHDLQWLAYQYVTNELSAELQESFELRLLDDQTAREAVADAMELHDGLVAACSRTLVVANSSPAVWKRLAGVAVTIAAVAVCVVLAQPEAVSPSLDPHQSADAPSKVTAVRQPSEDRHLAELWATQLEGNGREVAVAEDGTADVAESQEEIAWEGTFGDEAPAAWMWEALDATDATDSESDLDMPEEESL